ncbi:MAG: hypothetical protein WAP55_03480 [Minisyncoccia bacterium]
MGKTRVQFDFSERALKRLDDLIETTGASSRAEVVRHALQWYDWLVKLYEEGATFYAKPKKEGDALQEIPFLGDR